ncbi:MAG: hypothetical protein Q8N48_08800 [Thiobacillus sp.]|nr:hypothetical protein [Thiobacillus sp.]MDP2253023.1 hypothetical protein [Thiobacillus sp.]MDP2978908.1 hypothetical protein [Thiobacillus sp.]
MPAPAELLALVDRFREQLHEQLAAAKTAHDKTLIQRQIDATDRQLDALAYALYGLTDEEIRMVDAAKAPA